MSESLKVHMLASQLRQLGHPDLAKALIEREIPNVILVNDEAESIRKRRKGDYEL